MRRMLVVGMLAAVAVAVLAEPASAKGEADPLQGSLVISGPGLDQPMILNHGLGYDAAPAFGALLEASGMGGVPPEVGWYGLPPDRSTLGPEYRLEWVIRMDGRVSIIHQFLYPFAGDRPWFYTPRGQLWRNGRIGEWWSGPPSALSTLHGVGFPRIVVPVGAPPVAGPAAGIPAVHTVARPSSTRPWVWAVTIAALTLLLGVSAVSGRRRAVRAG